jgi:crotonobetainyl-CoA:carnitine CoA-transferase CaiB-like acyl-CoA transferase
MTRDEAVKLFTGIGLPCAPVYHIDETITDAHVNARDMFMEVEHPKAGKIKLIKFPLKFSETQPEFKTPAPLLGEHNREVLSGIMGYDDNKIKELMQKGIISYSN